MGVRWERLYGDTARFALRLGFQDDPDHGQAASDVESLSWGFFQLWVNGENLCRHLEDGETLESVHWYVLPLLEWLASNWDPLLHEERLPCRVAGMFAAESLQATSSAPPRCVDEEAQVWDDHWHSWWRRHSLQAAREGGLFPEVVFRRWRDSIEISWMPSALPGAPESFRFLSSKGGGRLAPEEVATTLHRALVDASEYFGSRDPTSGRLKQLLARIRALTKGRKEARLAWLAGLGNGLEEVQASWAAVENRFRDIDATVSAEFFAARTRPLVVTGSSQATLMFGTCAPTITPADVIKLADRITRLSRRSVEPDALTDITRSVPPSWSGSPSWQQGYALAEELADTLGIESTSRGYVDVDRVLKDLRIRVERMSLTDQHVRAIAIAGPQHMPAILINDNHRSNMYPSGYRFSLAHELCHLLFDRGRGQKLAIASGPWAPFEVEQRANAFSAAFLMPTALLQSTITKLAGSLETVTGVEDLAKRLRVSFTSALRHLANLGYLDDASAEALETLSWDRHR